MDIFDEIVKRAGSRVALANACGVSPQAVGKWKRKGIPIGKCSVIQATYGIPPQRIRPDISEIFGAPVRKASRSPKAAAAD